MNKVRLYIDGQLADLDEKSLVVMNYTSEELSNPTIVRNSYSQTVSLPATRTNNLIFDHIFRADHMTVDSKFNANVRTPFQLFSEKGEILEEGYIKLDTIEHDGPKTTYNCTLYGGLGSLFYGLTYADDDEKDKLTLADLTYSDNGDSDVALDFVINRTAVNAAWNEMDSPSAIASKWHIINFAPCYNGKPDGKFDAGKAVVYVDPTKLYGFVNSQTDGGNTFGTYNGSTFAPGVGWVLADLGEDRTEWQVKDLRTYLQRPVIKFSKILEGIQHYASAKGITLNLDSSFFNSDNPYYNDSWMTLPMLTAEEHKAESTALTVTIDANFTSGSYVDFELEIAEDFTGKEVTVNIDPKIRIRVAKDDERSGCTWRLDKDVPSWMGSHDDRGIFIQVYAEDANGDIVGASNILPIIGYAAFGRLQDFIDNNASAGIALGAVGTEFMDVAYGTSFNYLTTVGAYDYYDLPYWNGAPNPTVTMSASNVDKVYMRVTWATEHGNSTNRNAVWKKDGAFPAHYALIPCVTSAQLLDASGTASIFSIIRSGSTVTKQMLLGNTQTPADYLLSYAKKFGLVFEYEKGSKTVTLKTRDKYYTEGEDISLANRIDRGQKITSTPFVFDKKWYEFTEQNEDGKFAAYYDGEYQRTYGSQRINTGYVFNAETEQLLDGCAFKGCCEVQEQDTMFELITQNGKNVCVPSITGNVSYKLYHDNGGTIDTLDKDVKTPTSSAVITYYDNIYKGYDLYDKPQMRDDDNASVDGEDVLLFFTGCDDTSQTLYSDFKLTDDNAAMMVLNGDNFEGNGTPCWLIDYTNTQSFNLPRFSRFIYSAGKVVGYSMEMGTPKELDIPAITVSEEACVYNRGWRRYLVDRYDKDTRIMRCKVWMTGLKVGEDLMKNFYWFDNSLWVLNRIINWSFTTSEVAECEFIKVQDKQNYTNGQDY